MDNQTVVIPSTITEACHCDATHTHGANTVVVTNCTNCGGSVDTSQRHWKGGWKKQDDNISATSSIENPRS